MQKFYPLFTSLFACLLLTTCSKTENEVVYLPHAKSSFEVSVYDVFNNAAIEGKEALIDSNFYFTNLSDTGINVSYHWDFGDGTTSVEQHPKHHYAKKGKYKVKLETRVKDLVSSIFEKELSVVIGETYFALANRNMRGVDMVQLDNGSFVVLCAFENFENNEENYAYSLLFLDENRRETTRKELPSENRYYNLIGCTDGNFMLAASETQEINKIVKINPEGNMIWSRTYEEIAGILRLKQTTDGGYLLSCERNLIDAYGNPIPRAYLVKVDSDGNREWVNFFTDDEALYNIGGVHEENDGFVLSGSDVDFSNTECWSCSTLSLVKVNKEGKKLWRHHAGWGTIKSSGETSVFRLQNGQYIVTSRGNKALYFFSEQQGFVDRKLMPIESFSTVLTKQENIAILGEEQTNGSSTTSAGMTIFGDNRWRRSFEGRQRLPEGGYMCCVNSRPEKALALKDGGSLMLSTRITSTQNWNYYYEIVLLELDENGNVM